MKMFSFFRKKKPEQNEDNRKHLFFNDFCNGEVKKCISMSREEIEKEYSNHDRIFEWLDSITPTTMKLLDAIETNGIETVDGNDNLRNMPKSGRIFKIKNINELRFTITINKGFWVWGDFIGLERTFSHVEHAIIFGSLSRKIEEHKVVMKEDKLERLNQILNEIQGDDHE